MDNRRTALERAFDLARTGICSSLGDLERCLKLEGYSLALDVRELAELESNGRIEGALNIARGLLEARADPETSMVDERLTRLRGNGRIHIPRGSGARAAFAAHTPARMGYDATEIDGGIAAWKQAGLPVVG